MTKTKKKFDKVPWIIGGVLLLLIIIIASIIFFKTKGSDFPIGKFLGYLFGGVTLLACIGGLIYWMLNRKSGAISGEKIKEYVDQSDAISIWIEKFMIDNEIPFMTPRHTNFKPTPLNSSDIRIGDRFTFFKGSAKFLKMEVQSNAGQFIGMLVVIVRLDHGANYIEKNWCEEIKYNCTIESLKRNEGSYPLSSEQSDSQTIMLRALDVKDREGLTEDEFKDLMQPFKDGSVNSSAPKRPVERSRKPVLNAPSVFDYYPAQTEPSADEGDLQQDINEARERNA